MNTGISNEINRGVSSALHHGLFQEEPLSPCYTTTAAVTVWSTGPVCMTLDSLHAPAQPGAKIVYLFPAARVTFIERALFEISRQFSVNCPQVTFAWLRQNVRLIDLLREGRGKIREFFGNDMREVGVGVFIDPESEGESELVVTIRTPLPPAEALMRLDKLDRGWWLSAVERAQGKMVIEVEYC